MRAGAAWGCAALLMIGTASCSAPDEEPATVSLGGKEFIVEVAKTADDRQRGLAGRTSVPPGTGMLFPYESAAQRSFWMAGMEVPIDLAWIRGGQIVDVITLAPCGASTDCPSFSSPGPVDAVVEVAERELDGVDPGDQAVLPDL